MARDGGRGRRRRSRSRSSATRPRSSPPGRRPASASTSSPTRRPRTTRSPATSPAEICARRRATCCARAEPDVYEPPLDGVDGRPRPRDARVPGGRRRGVRLRQQPPRAGPGGGRRERLRLPGLRARVHPAAVLRGPRAVPLGGAVGRPGGHPAHGPRDARAVPATTAGLRRWIEMAEAQGAVPGPARRGSAGWATASGHRAGLEFNALVAAGEVQAPIVIGRDHLDCGLGRLAQPRDGGDGATAPTPSPTGRSSTRSSTPPPGATWVSIHHGGGVGIGYSQHAGMVVVADGTELAARKLERVLTTDPGMGVVRHVDAGYERAIDVARERGVRSRCWRADRLQRVWR